MIPFWDLPETREFWVSNEKTCCLSYVGRLPSLNGNDYSRFQESLLTNHYDEIESFLKDGRSPGVTVPWSPKKIAMLVCKESLAFFQGVSR